MSLTLQGLLKKRNPTTETQDQECTINGRPLRKAAAKAATEAVWFAAQGKKRPAASDAEPQETPGPGKNRSKPKGVAASKAKHVESDDSGPELASQVQTPAHPPARGRVAKKQRQLVESGSNSQVPARPPVRNHGAKKPAENDPESQSQDSDIDMEDEGRSAQYVPPRLARRQDPSQKPPTSGQRNRSPSSDGLSIPPVTDDDHSSLFEVGNGSDDDEDGSDKDKEEGIVVPKPKARATTSIKSKPGKSVSKSQSARAAKYVQEVPEFVAPATVPKKEPAAPRIWSPKAQYISPGPGQRLISKRTQSSEIQDVLTKATAMATGLFLLEDAYPDAARQSSMLRDALASAAIEVGLDELAERLCSPSERKWAKPLGDYVFNRVVHVRSEVKKAVEAVILDSEYPITGRLCDLPRYIAFVTVKCRYIFPLKARPPPEFDDVVVSGLPGPTPLPGEPNKEPAAEPPKIVTKRVERVYTPDYLNVNSLELISGAYKHGAIIATLRTMFTGTASCGQVLLPLFSSSLDDENYSEPELPMSMLALAAAAVHFCLQEWSSGSHSVVDFKGDKARPEYKKHIDYLLKIQSDNAVRYHDMMVDLLNRATEPVDGEESDGVPDIY